MRNEPTTEVAIPRAFAEDVYLVLAAFDLRDSPGDSVIAVEDDAEALRQLTNASGLLT